MSSTVIAKNVQIGADGTASNNFTIFQPATPDGTLRIGNGNTGITSSAVALTSAGNVGIGTSSPSAKLDVSTSINLSAQNYLNVAYDLGGGAGWLSGYNITYSSSSIRNVATGTLSGVVYGGSGLQFYTNTSAAAGTAASERMRIDSSGNVGIGTSSPTFLAGYAGVQINSASGTELRLTNSTVGTASTDGFALYCATSGDAFVWNTENANLRFGTNNTERARIDSSGNLLVGTTTIADSSGTGFKIGYNSATPYVTQTIDTSSSGAGTYHLYNVNATNNGYRFYVRSNGGISNYSGNNINLSDERTKTNIELAGGYLKKVCAIPVKLFNYKDEAEGEQRTLGVIAQDVEAVAPELVNLEGFGETPEDGVPLKAIYTTDMMFALMKCIQEQQALIASQSEIINAQQAALTALTARVTALEGTQP